MTPELLHGFGSQVGVLLGLRSGQQSITFARNHERAQNAALDVHVGRRPVDFSEHGAALRAALRAEIINRSILQDPASTCPSPLS